MPLGLAFLYSYHIHSTVLPDKVYGLLSHYCSWWVAGPTFYSHAPEVLILSSAAVGKGAWAYFPHTSHQMVYKGRQVPFSCFRVHRTGSPVPLSNRVSSVVFSRWGAGPVLPCAAASGGGQLYCFLDPWASSPDHLRWKGVFGRASFHNPCGYMANKHGWDQVSYSHVLHKAFLAPLTKKDQLYLVAHVKCSADSPTVITPGPALPSATGSQVQGKGETLSLLPTAQYGRWRVWPDLTHFWGWIICTPVQQGQLYFAAWERPGLLFWVLQPMRAGSALLMSLPWDHLFVPTVGG